jgi:hypothetical protein
VLQPTDPVPPPPAQSAASAQDPGAQPAPEPTASDDPTGTGTDPDGRGATGGSTDPLGDLVSDITDPVNALIPELPVGPVPEHTAPDGLVGAVVDLDLNGTGMPGATVSAQVAGQVYTTVVAANGKWAIRLTALPDGVGPIKLKQNLKILGITVPIDIPLALLSDTLGVTVELLN